VALRMPLRAVATDYLIGLAGAVGGGGVAYGIGELILRRLAIGIWGATLAGGLAVALLILGVVGGAGEPIFRRARRSDPTLGSYARKQLWKGAFLGAPTVIALLTVAEMDWTAIVASEQPFLPLRLLILLAAVVQFVATAPVRFLVYAVGLPAELVMMLAAPIGAVVVRHRSELLPLSVDGTGSAIPTEDPAAHDRPASAR